MFNLVLRQVLMSRIASENIHALPQQDFVVFQKYENAPDAT